ncbi:TPA: TMAO reductase system periplasmic protein TorT [Providencia rettgeri]|uniref:TMAO reductase system periplasmic protein TorT n=1 Tax=Providencia TaxID=586 RepID=UPI001B9A652A|nr:MULTISPECIES: TMAO reductase system periplasmic protein TorT [Providencia]EMB5786177.1 TMAO reductase system periplasmic protein TorT [Providencia rettgeri]MDK7744494.1 TMAO reductase system periplasmic protein TorT [Providencia rettgeri]MDK7757216.1 TMAO reductase system periplasmic protein TorT [Providencia rettgeri]HBC7428698.1 TMAO reductase system periplasmic protein TorT [Providencia rettgeri]
MRVLILLLFTFHSLLSLAMAQNSSLIQWRDTLHFTSQPHNPITATKTWKLCALYPSLKDSYWLSINYGMQKAAKRYGVDLNVLEAGGYNQLATQQKQITQCQQWGADAILLGSSTTAFPNLSQLVGNTPIIEVINATHDKTVKTRVGVPWFQMGYQPGRYLVQWSQGKPLKVLLMPGPLNAGGSHEMEQGFREAIAGSHVQIVDVAQGDNDIEVQRNLLHEMLERNPDIDVVVGTAIAAEAAMGEGRNLTKPLNIVSFYLSHQVYRGLKRGRIIMAASDQMVWQGELVIEQAIKVLQKQPVPNNISPPILVLTQQNADSEHLRNSLSPGGFRPVYQYTSAAKK